MRHLFPSKVEVLESSVTDDHGRPVYSWGVVGQLWCRIDLDPFSLDPEGSPQETGRMRDRTGVAFFHKGAELDASHRIRCVVGPVEGTFELQAEPDQAMDRTRVHHLEVPVREVAQ